MTAHGALDDAAVDALQPRVSPDPGRTRIRAGASESDPEGLWVLENLMVLSDMDDLLLLADGLLSGDPATRATDAGGIRVTGDRVQAWDAGDHTVTVGRAALVRLMARVLALAAESVADAEVAGRLAASARAACDSQE